MREKGARLALWAGLSWMTLALSLWGSSGGFTGQVLGLRFQVQALRSPMWTGMLLLAAWAVLSRDGARRVAAWLAGLDAQGHARLSWGLGALATAWLAVVKGWQHYSLQTCAYDLGIYANVIWNTAHGNLFYSAIENQNYLGDHFSLYFVFLAPLTHAIDASVLMILLQCGGIGLAAVAVYRLTLRLVPPQAGWAPLALSVLFLCNPYLGEVSRFDAHPIALAIPLFLWMMLFIEEERYLGVCLLAIVAPTIEETLLPPLVVSGLYLAARGRSTRGGGLLMTGLALAFFACELRWWMPLAIDRTDIAHATRYANLGDTLPQVFANIARNPLLLLRELTTPPAKIWTCFSLLASAAFLPLFSPRHWLLIAAPLASVIVSCSDHQYRLVDQYSSTTLPFLFYGAAHGLAWILHGIDTKVRPWSVLARPQVGLAACILLVATSLRTVPDYMGDWNQARVRAVHAMMAHIPPGGTVCAMQTFVPHLVGRRQVTMFGDSLAVDWCIRGAEWLLVDSTPRSSTDAYPLGHEGTRAAAAALRKDPRYSLVEEAHGVLLFRKVAVARGSH